MKVYTVEFVYLDEATPRALRTVQVEAADAEEAKLHAWTEKHLAGDRISVADVIEIGEES